MTQDEIKTLLSKAEPLCGMVPLDWEGRPAMMVPDPDSALGFSVLDPIMGWAELDAWKVLRSAVPITWREYVALTASENREWADRVPRQFRDSTNKTVAELPPPPRAKPKSAPTDSMTVQALEEPTSKMDPEAKTQRDPKRYQIADVERGGNIIKIDVTVQDDGGVRTFDWSMGSAADEFYGEGSDVEHWLDITPEAARQLSVKLFRDWVEQPAEDVAKYLVTRFQGDTKAISKIQALLDELDVPYEQHLWT